MDKTDERYIIYSPSIPLNSPNKFKSVISKDFYTENIKRPYKENILQGNKHYTRLRKKHSDIFHASLSTIGEDKFIRKCLSRFRNSLQHSRKLHGYSKNVYEMKCEMMSNYISDIPKDIIVPLLDESICSEIENVDENYNLKNCLAQYEQNERCIIFCPTGELMDYIAMKEILIDSADEDNHLIGFKMLKSVELLKVHVDYCVKEIICGRQLLHVRGDYQYHVYHINLTETSSNLTLVRQLNFDKMVHSIGVNFHSSDEIFVVMDDRTICHIFDKPKPKRIINNIDSECVKWQTCIYGTSRGTCLVSNEKEVCLYDIRIKDTSPCTYFNVMSCNYIDNEIMRLSPVLSWNSMHQHQYFVSSNCCMLLNDDRYLKTPVFQINHYMNSPPYFMQMIPGTSDINQNALFITGSYKSAESVLYQLSSNGISEISFGSTEKLGCKNPVTVTQPLYQLSSYSDWKTYITDWKFSLSFTQRLSLPSIGICSTRLPLSTNCKNDFAVIQQSLAGDVFFQQVSSVDSSLDKSENSSIFQRELLIEEAGDNHVSLIRTCKKRCKQWMDDIVGRTKIYNVMENNFSNTGCSNKSKTMEISADSSMCTGDDSTNIKNETRDCACCSSLENKDNPGYCEEMDHYKTHINDEFEYKNPYHVTLNVNKMIGKLKNSSKLHICLTQDDEKSDVNNSQCFCVECANEWHDKLSKLKEKKVVTRKILDLPEINDLPSAVTDAVKKLKFQDRPLNNLLRTQWEKDEYVPLDTFASNLQFDIEQYI